MVTPSNALQTLSGNAGTRGIVSISFFIQPLADLPTSDVIPTTPPLGAVLSVTKLLHFCYIVHACPDLDAHAALVRLRVRLAYSCLRAVFCFTPNLQRLRLSSRRLSYGDLSLAVSNEPGV